MAVLLSVGSFAGQIGFDDHIVVQVSRLMGGGARSSRYRVQARRGNYTMQDILHLKQNGVDEDRRAQGCFQGTGIRPNCLSG